MNPEIEKNLKNLATVRGVAYEDILKRFNEILSSTTLQEHIEGERLESTAYAILVSRLSSRGTLEDVNGILVGYGNLTKKEMRSMYCLDSQKQIFKIVLSKAKGISMPLLFKAYEFKASKGQQSNVYFADDLDYKQTNNKDFSGAFLKMMENRTYNIKDSLNYIPEQTSTGYPDDTKWIGVKAIVASRNVLENVVVTTLTDTSIIDAMVDSIGQDFCEVDGHLINQGGITCWISKEKGEHLLIDSEVVVYGYLRKREGKADGEVQFYGQSVVER